MALWSLGVALGFGSGRSSASVPVSPGGAVVGFAADIQVAEAQALPLGLQQPRLTLRPRRMACAGASIFLADPVGLYRLEQGAGDGGLTTPLSAPAKLDCGLLGSTISDVASFCENGACRPLVLLPGEAGDGGDGGSAARVVDCDGGASKASSTMPLLLDADETTPAPAFLAVRVVEPGRPLTAQRLLLASRDGAVMQYAWMLERGGWVAERTILSSGLRATSSRGSSELRGIAAAAGAGSLSDENLYLFWSGNIRDNVLEAWTIDAAQPLGAWTIPDGVGLVASGCSLPEARTVLALPESAASLQGGERNLWKLRLAV
eukprot:TRINITY_DN40979_c0_g1_i1.p1 TRINITY_DN40979_c0_g1~~TRINITY_DN40979_c0_g1_i1.p1  ORF type:complete len:352 (-),score=62.13 TRINITY_DN40979_c0_g1_i1:38-994(-)